MKSKYLAIALMVGMAISVTSVFAAPATYAWGVQMAGNNTTAAGSYYHYEILNITALNSTINSSDYTYYQVWFNVSMNSTSPTTQDCNATLEELNFTFGVDGVDTTVTEIGLYNQTRTLIMNANNTYTSAEGLTIANFNSSGGLLFNEPTSVDGTGDQNNVLTNYSCGYGGVDYCNVTMFVQFRVVPRDNNRSVSATSTGDWRLTNISYFGLSLYNSTTNVSCGGRWCGGSMGDSRAGFAGFNLTGSATASGVNMIYLPGGWSQRDLTDYCTYGYSNGSTGSFDVPAQEYTDSGFNWTNAGANGGEGSMLNGSAYYLECRWAVPGTPTGGDGGSSGGLSVTPTSPLLSINVILIAIISALIVITLVAVYFIKKDWFT